MTANLIFKSMTVEEGFLHILNQLEETDIEYAVNTHFEGITPFGILGDLCDHNMLFPFADDGALDEEGHILEEWIDFANAVAERFNQHICQIRQTKEAQKYV